MQAENLTEVAAAQVAAARAAGSGRSTQTVVGGQGRILRQAVMALAAGHGLGEHESPKEATLQVLVGRVRLTAGEQVWEGAAGDHLIIPDRRHDLLALCDDTAHDDRYTRTVEYTAIIQGLLRGETVTLDGRWHQVSGLTLTPALPEELMGEVLVSGSSPAGRAAAAELGAVPVRYPQPLDGSEQAEQVEPGSGVRVGIIARETADEAWQVAHERFPTDREGQVAHRMAMAVSDSHWHQQLSARITTDTSLAGEPDPYWLGPFQNYQSFCPYLVGSHDTVAAAVAHYLDQGTDLFVLDIPPSAEELEHAGVAFARAQEVARA